jgi:hypothetical protein
MNKLYNYMNKLCTFLSKFRCINICNFFTETKTDVEKDTIISVIAHI